MTITQILKISLKDFKTPLFLGLSLLPFVVILLLFSYGYFHFGADLVTQVQESLSKGEIPFLDAKEHPYLSYILSLSLFQWLFSLFFYLFGIVFVILLSVAIAGAVIGFFTPLIVKTIRKRHYPDFPLPKEEFTLLSMVPYYLKIGFITLLLGFLALPMLFIPALNVIAVHLPFYYLFHNFLLLDVGSSILSKKDYQKTTKKYKGFFRSLTLTLYGVSLVPILGVFMQVYYVIALAHTFFQKGKEE